MSSSPPIQGPALRQARIDAGLSADEFAALAGISRSTYYNAESETRAPNLRTSRRIRAALDQIAACPRIDRVSELEAKVDKLSQQVEQLVDAQAGAVA